MLERAQIVKGLERLAELLAQRGVQGEICLLGGTVMVLAFNARTSTKDVDAVFEPVAIVRELAIVIERELDPSDANDLRFLISHLQLRNVEEALEIVARYYVPARVPARAQYLLEELFAEAGS